MQSLSLSSLSHKYHGFTLIELSIVMVIIGFIVGGVLTGKELIRASTVRAQISQLEKYNQAINTFRAKYDDLPGDLSTAKAAKFGFVDRAGCRGLGDSNGLSEGVHDGTCKVADVGGNQPFGEPQILWMDLAQAHLIEGEFSPYYKTYFSNSYFPFSIPNVYVQATIANTLPASVMGNELYVYVWNGAADGGNNFSNIGSSLNYFGLAGITDLNWFYQYNNINANSTAGRNIEVRTAYMIDSKLDDGLPQSGNVRAINSGCNNSGPAAIWADPNKPTVTSSNYDGYTTALSGSTFTCYDNGGVSGATMTYSITTNQGTARKCAMSFKFQ